MCGIAGFWTSQADFSRTVLDDRVSKMTDTLVKRGPDDSGVWSDAQNSIALGHRRLSVIDISEHGHQPMTSADGRYVIVYNGEIYNFKALSIELEKAGHSFRGHSDTEVILAAFSEWGLEKAVSLFDGMFAFALWDRKNGDLSLVRDRIGEKPLYYGAQNGTLYFASELKAIRAHADFQPVIDRNALISFLQFSYIPAPDSIYSGIRKLLPGHILRLKSPVSTVDSKPYWSLENSVHTGAADPYQGTDEEAVRELERMLRQTVKSRMVSDVPLGAFLSGGIDSSTIVALMQSQCDRPVNTYTIGFHEQGFDEAVFAKKVAQHLGTNHTELYLSSGETMDVITKLPEVYDEPFADSSQIPTYLISALTRKHVTVSLSGDGGDELFGGYTRYFIADHYWNRVRRVPYFIRKLAAKCIQSIPFGYADGFYNKMKLVLPFKIKQSLPVEKFYKLGQILSHSNMQSVYKRLVSVNYDPLHLVCGGNARRTIIDNSSIWDTMPDQVTSMQYLDLMTYHPDDILVKVDRAAMAVSLETRVPFLDHEIVKFAMSLPLNMRVRNGQGKWLLRQVLYRYIPQNLIDRPKMGFGVPLGRWLRGPLKDWACDLLDERRLRQEGFLNPQKVSEMWQRHQGGHYNHRHELWNILMFQAWLDKWG
jgi:asparagine synthase (glutamine-hydrolysing)